MAAPGDQVSKAEFPTEVEGHGSALDLERVLLHFSNVGSTKLKTVFPNSFFPSFLSHSVCAEEGRPCAFDSFTPEIITLSPLRSPVSQKPSETLKPFHPLFKPGPCMLLRANECGGFQSRRKAFLQTVTSAVKSSLSSSSRFHKKQGLGEISARVKTARAAGRALVSSCKKLSKVDLSSVPGDCVH